MKKRSEEILQSLLKGYRISIYSLKKQYKVTERTLRNDLVEINEFLRSLRISNIYFNGDGILEKGSDFEAEKVEHELHTLDPYYYKLSPEERSVYIATHLLWKKEQMIMQNLADDLYVTRITILNDFERIKKDLNENDIRVVSDAGKGVRVLCSQIDRINTLIYLLRNVFLDIHHQGFFQRYLLKSLNIKYTFSDIYWYVQEYLTVNNLVFVEDVLYNIVLCIFVQFNTKDAKDEEVDDTIRLNEMDNLMMYVGYKLNTFISYAMLVLFRQYRDAHQIESFVKNLDVIQLYEVLTNFLVRIDKEMGLSLSRDPILADALLLHIKNMRDWGNLRIELPDMEESVFNYKRLQDVVENNLFVLERYLQYEINENMKKSIMIHICVALIRNNNMMSKPTVVIVCPGSMATGRYLEAQLKNYFDFNILDVIPAAEINHQLQNFSNVDFIISTVRIHGLEIPCLKVHAVLDMEDMNRIQKQAFEVQNNKPTIGSDHSLDQLQEVMNENELSDSLMLQIQSLIEEHKNEKQYKKTSIGALMERHYICIDDEMMDWRQAIEKAATPLLKADCITQAFIVRCIANIEEYGDYIILGQGVALAHAGKDYGVNKDGMSLLVSHTGIELSEGLMKIHFLFCFASRGVNEYVSLFNEIVRIGQDMDFNHSLLIMDEEALYQTLCYKD